MTTCPIQREIDRAGAAGAEFLQAVRRLRRAMFLCDRCAALEGCPVRERFYQKIDSVIARVVDEWKASSGA